MKNKTNKTKVIENINKLEDAQRRYALGKLSKEEFHIIAENVNRQWQFMGLERDEMKFAISQLKESGRKMDKFLDNLEEKYVSTK